MATAVRPTNKVIWALSEAIEEHDGEIAELLGELVDRLESEQGIARQRFDKAGQLRVAEMVLLVARLQGHTGRLASLHRQARGNEYDRR